jgi:trehalose-phosphatase
VFIGDDVTDEDGFAELGPQDVAIRVGGGETRAPFGLDSPDDVADFLERLVTGRLH